MDASNPQVQLGIPFATWHGHSLHIMVFNVHLKVLHCNLNSNICTKVKCLLASHYHVCICVWILCVKCPLHISYIGHLQARRVEESSQTNLPGKGQRSSKVLHVWGEKQNNWLMFIGRSNLPIRTQGISSPKSNHLFVLNE